MLDSIHSVLFFKQNSRLRLASYRVTGPSEKGIVMLVITVSGCALLLHPNHFKRQSAIFRKQQLRQTLSRPARSGLRRMFNIDVAIFSRNRLGHLRLCTQWLKESEPSPVCSSRLICYDDSSDCKDTQSYQQQVFDSVVLIPRDGRANTPDQRIGCARHFAVDQFLRKSKADFLLLLDSDND